VPPPLDGLAAIIRLPDSALVRRVDSGEGSDSSIQFVLYDLLRREQALAAEARPERSSEAGRILDLTQMAYGELVGLLVGRTDGLLETARDGEWSLRDLLRHAIAVELRYAAQIEWSATRRDDDPLAIPLERLPCDRLAPPEPEFADSRGGGLARMLELLGDARARSNERLQVIPGVALARPSLWGTSQVSVRTRLHQFAAHLAEVVIQGEKYLGSNVDAEARRIVRRCCAMRGLHERWSGQDVRTRLDARYSALAVRLDHAAEKHT
jgi:hypothetical protein